MLDFEYYTPTRVFFGKSSNELVGKKLIEYGCSRILLIYGGGSAEKSGLLSTIRAQLKEEGLEFWELGGIEANPKIGPVYKGMEICIAKNVDMILAVGGGSVVDTAKAISLGAANNVDPWDIVMNRVMPKERLPVTVVLTLAAAGSEMSDSFVLTNPEKQLKRGFNNNINRPALAFMNPENTFSVSKFQTGCGIVDIMMHTLERYFTVETDNELIDRISEGLLVAVKNAGSAAIENPNDYEARAALMWASSLSHNDLTGSGKAKLFSVHKISHDFCGLFDHIAHGAILSVLFPAWAKYVYKQDVRKFSQFAVRVFGIDMNFENPEATALKGIEALKLYFRSLGMPTTLPELSVSKEDYERIVNYTTNSGAITVKSYFPLTKEDLLNIYKLAEE